LLSNGPRRAAFKLTYAPWDAGAGKAEEIKQFTIDCGVNFDTVDSTFDLGANEAVIGIGLTDHAAAAGFPAGVLTHDPQGRWMSLWEEDKNGGLGTAVILGRDVQAAGFAHEAPAKTPGNGNHLLLVNARDGAPLRYYTGAGWNRSGQFADRAGWEAYVQAFAAGVAHPLKIAVAKQ
jgi:pectinesterase